MIKRAKLLKLIVDTFIITLPSIANMGGMLLIILFIYAVLGVQLLAPLKLNGMLDRRANF